MTARCWILSALLLGCVDLYSEHDRLASSLHDASTDRGIVADRATPTDRGAGTDSGAMNADVIAVNNDRPTLPDVTSPTDVAMELDAGPTGPLRLRAQGFSSGGIVGENSGALRLVEWGFEQGQTTCAGALCVTGGVTP